MAIPRRWLLFFGIAINLALFPLNHVVGIVANHGDYTPFAVGPQVSDLVYDETQAYAAGPARFFRTGEIPAETDVFELRDVPNGLPILHSILLGALAKALGSPERAWMAAHAIVPALIWALLFWNACARVRSGILACAVAWATCIVAFSPRNSLFLGKGVFTTPPELTRLAEPALGFLFLILAMWLLSRALTRPALWRILLAGVTSGALFYLYYYYWVAFFAGVGCYLIVAALATRKDHVKTIALVAVVGSLTGIPFLISTLHGMRAGQQRDLMNRLGEFTHQPDLIGLLLAVVLVTALWFFSQRQPGEESLFSILCLAVAAGSALGLNAQVFTGFDPQNVHFYHRVLQPLLMFVVLSLCFRAWPLPDRLIAGLTIVLLAATAWQQIEVGKNLAQYHRKSNPDMDVLLWARAHLPAGSVIGSTDGNLLTMIPAITGTWNFVPVGARTVASDEEILRRYLLLGRIEGKTWPEMEAALKSDRGSQPYRYPLNYILIMPRHVDPAAIVGMAKKIWDNPDSTPRKLDYLIEAQTGPPRPGTVYQNGDASIRRVGQF